VCVCVYKTDNSTSAARVNQKKQTSTFFWSAPRRRSVPHHVTNIAHGMIESTKKTHDGEIFLTY